MAIPMVPEGHWSQQSASSFWRNYQARDGSLTGEPELEATTDSEAEELSASILEANHCVPADLSKLSASSKHDHLSELQK